MQDPSIFPIFASRLNILNIRYMITGSVASIVYGEPRMTHDIDLVMELEYEDTERFAKAFPIETFYCPPTEVIKVELGRSFRGHFNLIHHETGFKADIYLRGRDPLHEWALNNRKKIDIEGEYIWVAPVEYVILRKLEYYREGKSEKHIRDIKGILSISADEIDFEELEKRVESLGLSKEWDLVRN
jgi:hypothetical protein